MLKSYNEEMEIIKLNEDDIISPPWGHLKKEKQLFSFIFH